MATTDRTCPKAVVEHLLELYPAGTVTPMGTVNEGLSGATVLLVHVKARQDVPTPSDTLGSQNITSQTYDGLAFAKIDRADRSLEEYWRHAMASTECTSSFIPGVIGAPLGPIEGWRLVLYRPAQGAIAGARSLAQLIALTGASDRLAGQVRHLLSAIAVCWHDPSALQMSERPRPIPQLVRTMFNRGGTPRIRELRARLKKVGLPGREHSTLQFMPGNLVLPNPFAHLFEESPWRRNDRTIRSLVAPMSPSQGDLHAGNLICRLTESGQLDGTATPWVIDCAQFEKEQLPFFDLAYLELDLLLRWLPAEQEQDWFEWQEMTSHLSSGIIPGSQPAGTRTPAAWTLVLPVREHLAVLLEQATSRSTIREQFELAWWLAGATVGALVARRQAVTQPNQRIVSLLYGARCMQRFLQRLPDSISRPDGGDPPVLVRWQAHPVLVNPQESRGKRSTYPKASESSSRLLETEKPIHLTQRSPALIVDTTAVPIQVMRNQDLKIDIDEIALTAGFVPVPTVPTNESNLPHRSPNFVGRRTEIRQVLDALSSRAWIVTIDGMGGMGKTTLALEVAHICRDQDSAFINVPTFSSFIWASGRDRPDYCLNDVVREILSVLSDSSGVGMSQDVQLSQVIKLLASKPRLLIIDNFETVKDEALHRFLRDQVPSPSKVLLTSRHHIQTGERVVTIGGLDESDAIRLLELEAGRLQIPLISQDTVPLRLIAQKTFGIPVALRWVMECVFNGLSLEWALQALENATADDIFLYIFQLSLSLVDEETRRVFRSLSLFDGWIDLESIAALNPKTAALRERLGYLVTLSLLEDNKALVQDNKRYRLPPLARYMAASELGTSSDRNDVIARGLERYSAEIVTLPNDALVRREYIAKEANNVAYMVRVATSTAEYGLVHKSLAVVDQVMRISQALARPLLREVRQAIEKLNAPELTREFVNLIHNPYAMGTVATSDMFFGRQDLLTRIRDNLGKGANISLVGYRRAGKTSILFELLRLHEEEASRTDLYVYLDLAPHLDERQFLQYLAWAIHRRASTVVPDVETPENMEIDRAGITHYVEHVESRLHIRNLVLVCDEFDALFLRRPDDKGDLISLLGFLRQLIASSGVSMVTAGHTPLAELERTFVKNELATLSPFSNLFQTWRVPPLEPDAAEQLIQQPLEDLLTFTQESVRAILYLTGCQPYLVHLMCSELTDECLRMGHFTVDEDLVMGVAERLSAGLSNYLGYQYASLSEFEKILAQLAASIAKDASGTFGITDLLELLGSDELLGSNDRKVVRRALLRLAEQGIIAQGGNQPERYRFAAGLFLIWASQSEQPW